jgi:hypothetical protein
MIFFCKIIEFLYPHHPDRLSISSIRRLALWVAPTASAKKLNILPRKKSYDAFFLILSYYLRA